MEVEQGGAGLNKTAKELAQFIEGELVGKEDLVITGVNSIEDARDGDLTFAASEKHRQLIEKTNASCVVTTEDVKSSSKTIIRTKNPAVAFAKILSLVSPEGARHPKGIHPTAVLEKTAVVGKDVSIGAYSVISEGVEIGDGSVIYAGCYVGPKSKIGSSTVIYPGVVVRDRMIIGSRVIIHSGTIVGTDGFGYHQVGAKHMKIPQVGIVVIEDDVEIGSCVTIDRATLGKTVIGKGTKIDNLVQIAHNVKLGENCILAGQAGIAGSSRLGRNTMLGAQAGVVDHATLGEKVMGAAKAGVSKSYPAGSIVLGIPARPYREAKKIMAASGRLPHIIQKVNELEKKIKDLEKKVK